jgi:hypothetical protein
LITVNGIGVNAHNGTLPEGTHGLVVEAFEDSETYEIEFDLAPMYWATPSVSSGWDLRENAYEPHGGDRDRY